MQPMRASRNSSGLSGGTITDLTGQLLEQTRYVEMRQDARFAEILSALQSSLNRLETSQKELGGKVEASQKELGGKVEAIEKDVAAIRLVGSVLVVLVTLGTKVPQSLWDKLLGPS